MTLVGPGIDGAASRRSGQFCQWYEATHDRIIGVGYFGTNADYMTALRLVAKFTDQQLQDAATYWFGMRDDFAASGTRSVAKFASRISFILEQIRLMRLA